MRSMAGAVAGVLEGVRGLSPVGGPAVAGVLAARGWAAGGRVRAGYETSWRRDGVGGWVHPYRGGVRVEFTVWVREPDPDTGYFGDLEAVYEEAGRVLEVFAAALAAALPGGRLAPVARDGADAEEFIESRAWSYGGRRLVAGAVQEDGDLPVRVVVAWEELPGGEPGPAGRERAEGRARAPGSWSAYGPGCRQAG
jgi:hypothetical protein